ncbi:hypothetical protein, partial [Vibrio cholerae]|uniref:hypothetical protein n=1 Tax=Vibrio cholerae TaxID=666 RepID=UPI0030199AA4
LPEGNFACKIQVYFVRSYKMRILPFREETKNRTRPRIRTIQIESKWVGVGAAERALALRFSKIKKKFY